MKGRFLCSNPQKWQTQLPEKGANVSLSEVTQSILVHDSLLKLLAVGALGGKRAQECLCHAV